MLVGAAVGVLGLAVAGGAAKAADMVVLDSNYAKYQVSTVIDGSQAITLPAGKMIELLGADGSTRKIEGPYSAKPGADIGDTGAGSQLVAALSGLLKDSKRSTASLGTIRSGGAIKGVSDDVVDPYLVNVDVEGNRCITQGPVILQSNADNSAARKLVLQQRGRVKKLSGRWPSNTERLQMPANFRIRDNSVYNIALGESKPIEITFHIMPANLKSPTEQAVWMASKKCKAQTLALLRSERSSQ
jgi:hypothetical protein